MTSRVSRGDLLAVVFLAVLAFCFLAPAIKDGPSFGPADIARGLSYLTRLPGPLHHNHNVVNGDQIDQSIPWNTLDWRLVRHGELPLWNGLSGTGLPQLLNFESAPFALPTLVGYLFPLSLAFLVTVGVKLLIAGTGVYAGCRLLGCRPLAAAFGGATAMLSGNLSGWLGWPASGTLVWTGWLLAGILLCYRSRSRSDTPSGLLRGAGPVALLGLSSAFAVYGGFPEGYVLLAFGLGVVLLATTVARLLERRQVSLVGIGRIVIALALGAGLSAPLWLPGIPVLRASARAGKQAATGLTPRAAALLLVQGFYGLPSRGSYYFGAADYYETAAYLGVLAVVLAVVAVVRLWRRPAVAGLAAATLACLALVYRIGPGGIVQHLVSDVGLGAVAVQRGLAVLGAIVAVLAALGLEVLLSSWGRLSVRATFLGASAVLAVVLVLLWISSASVAVPAGGLPAYHIQPSSAILASLRRRSLIWPTAEVAGLLAGGVLASRLALVRWRPRWIHGAHVRPDAAEARFRRRVTLAAGGGLLAVQSAFLLFAGVGLNSYAAASYPETPSLSSLQSAVGSQLLGLDAGNVDCSAPVPPPPECGIRRWNGVGLYPEVNVAYGLDELAMHDPTIPRTSFEAWPVPNADQHFEGNFNVFVPDVDSLALARRYGVAYVLSGYGRPAPAGMTKVAAIPANDGDPRHAMTLYRVPGSARFSFLGSPAGDRVVSVSHPGDASYQLRLDVATPATLFLRITDVPGWQASADGRALSVGAFEGMLAVDVPAGAASLQLRYWPPRLGLAFALAFLALAVLTGWGVSGEVVRRRSLRRAGHGAGERVARASGGALPGAHRKAPRAAVHPARPGDL